MAKSKAHSAASKRGWITRRKNKKRGVRSSSDYDLSTSEEHARMLASNKPGYQNT